MNRSEIVLAGLAAAGENATFTPVQVQKLFFLLDREAASYWKDRILISNHMTMGLSTGKSIRSWRIFRAETLCSSTTRDAIGSISCHRKVFNKAKRFWTTLPPTRKIILPAFLSGSESSLSSNW
jgi:hypothetical protein